MDLIHTQTQHLNINSCQTYKPNPRPFPKQGNQQTFNDANLYVKQTLNVWIKRMYGYKQNEHTGLPPSTTIVSIPNKTSNNIHIDSMIFSVKDCLNTSLDLRLRLEDFFTPSPRYTHTIFIYSFVIGSGKNRQIHSMTHF